jgi:hypothetical protein
MALPFSFYYYMTLTIQQMGERNGVPIVSITCLTALSEGTKDS